MAVRDATLGEKAAGVVASSVGSWRFVLTQTVFLTVWIIVNTVPAFIVYRWDVEPFILLNLVLSFQSAYTGPIVMISQNRQERILHAMIGALSDQQEGILAMMEAQGVMFEEFRQHLKAMRDNDSEILEGVEELLEDKDDGRT